MAMSSQLTKRILSAAVLVPAVVAILWAGGLALAALFLFMFVVSVKEWVYISTWQGQRQAGLIAFGLVYLSAAFYALIETGLNQPSLYLPLYLLLAVWLSDTGAYILGKTIGGPKMAPKISPNKTWAGFVGACLFPAVGIAIYRNILAGDAVYVGGGDMMLYAVIGLATGTFGQIGDVSISWIKRKAGVKDTGALIPGHGGILDRIDALLLLAILFWGWMVCGGYETLFPDMGAWRPVWHAL